MIKVKFVKTRVTELRNNLSAIHAFMIAICLMLMPLVFVTPGFWVILPIVALLASILALIGIQDTNSDFKRLVEYFEANE